MSILQNRFDAEFLLAHMCSVKFKEWIVSKRWDAFQFTGPTAAVCLGFIFPAAITLNLFEIMKSSEEFKPIGNTYDAFMSANCAGRTPEVAPRSTPELWAACPPIGWEQSLAK